MITIRSIQSLSFDNEFMYLHSDEKLLKINIEHASLKLKNADDFQRSFYKISASGYGIHWPLIDEDLAIEALLKISE